MNISINTADGLPIYRQIANQIRYMIASGLLKANEELPAIRALAMQLRVTPNTIVKAYGELESAGIIFKKRGSGCFVAEVHSRLTVREKHRILEKRIDDLLSESHQLNVSTEALFKLIHKRLSFLQSKNMSNKEREGKSA